MGESVTGQEAIFHITHWKAGSQWVVGILRQLLPEQFVAVKKPLPDLLAAPGRPDAVYTPVYLPRHRFLEAVGDRPHRRFIVIRDLRDTLVSWYFSLRFSHPHNAFVADQRAQFESMETDDALISLMEGRLVHIAAIQRTWINTSDPAADLLVRYEELLADDQAGYERILSHLHLNIPAEVRQRIVAANRFENRTGRKRGEEDAGNHRRKGVAGDWRNHFTPRVTEAFKRKYGHHLIDTGYESNLDW
jgi:hypothetical protein